VTVPVKIQITLHISGGDRTWKQELEG